MRRRPRHKKRQTRTATRLPGGSGTAAAEEAAEAELIEFEVGGLAAGLRGERSFFVGLLLQELALRVGSLVFEGLQRVCSQLWKGGWRALRAAAAATGFERRRHKATRQRVQWSNCCKRCVHMSTEQ